VAGPSEPSNGQGAFGAASNPQDLDGGQGQAYASFALRNSARWTLAARDADLHFPAAAISFSCTLGVPINATGTPRLLLLMRRYNLKL